MNRDEDQTYYSRRAEVERARAITCTDPSAALVHMTMADEYERRAQGGPDDDVSAFEPAPRMEHATLVH